MSDSDETMFKVAAAAEVPRNVAPMEDRRRQICTSRPIQSDGPESRMCLSLTDSGSLGQVRKEYQSHEAGWGRRPFKARFQNNWNNQVAGGG